MKNTGLLLVFIVTALLMPSLFTGCTTATEPAPTILGPQAEQIEPQLDSIGQMVDTLLTRSDFRGVALISQDGNIILREAYGMACDIQSIENTVYSPFHLASISKQFTGSAILLLKLDGKLNTSDTLDNFFTGHDGLGNVTVAHLLAMKGGFFDYSNWLFELLDAGEFEKALSLSAEDIETHIISNWSGAPQDEPAYCNSDYWLLGRIIEKVSGMSYKDFVQTRLFYPLGMANSGFGGSHESVAPHGIPHINFAGQNVMDVRNLPFFFLYSTGGLISTVDDLQIWLDSYFGGKLFPTYLLEDILGGRYNYGWAFTTDSIWHHPGDMPGFTTRIIYDRDSNTSIILLSNYDSGIPWSLIRPISRTVLSTEVTGLGIPIGN